MKRSLLIGLGAILILTCPHSVRAEDDVKDPFSFSANYEFFWFKKNPLATPLLTTGNPNSPTGGGLADPSTQVLIGGNDLNKSTGSGLSSEITYAFMPGLTWTLGGFYMFDVSQTRMVNSDANGNPFLFRPFYDVETNNPNAGVIITQPGVISGGVVATQKTEFWGLESNMLCGIYGEEHYCFSGIVGVRYLQLLERLSIGDKSVLLQDNAGGIGPTPLYTGDTITEYDQFRMRNQFLGGQIGGVFETRFYEKFWVAATGKVALGMTHETLTANGMTTAVSSTIGTITAPAGILAVASNSGQYSRDRFAYVPEFDLKFGYDITCRIRAVAGYHFLYWSNVGQTGQQVPTQISSNQVPAYSSYGQGAQPIPVQGINSGSFWLQGLQCGLEFKF